MMLILAMVVSCGTNGSQGVSKGAITTQLAWNTTGKTTTKTVASAPYGVTTVRIIVSATDIATFQKDFTAASGSGTIDGVAPGTGRNLTAQGLDGVGTVIYQGTVANLAVLTGQTTNAGIITMITVTPLPTSPVGKQMGGARQGTPLALTTVVTTLAGGGFDATHSESIDGTGTAASFNTSGGSITTDGSNLYLADRLNNKIRKIEIANGVVTTFAGSGASGFLDGTGTSAIISMPQGITTDGTNLYVADRNNDRVRKIVISTGVVTTLAGPTIGVLSNGAQLSLSGPRAITTDGTNVYVANGYVVYKVVIATGAVTNLAGGGLGVWSGAAGYADGTGKAALFNGLNGITTDGTNLYVTDDLRIRKIVIATGVVTTIAGSALGSFPGIDGTGIAATFNVPIGITTDGSNLYVADSNNYIIRKIVIATGVVTTLAGPGVTGTGGSLNNLAAADGTGSKATLFGPTGITSDGRNLYVSDSFLIRKIQ